MEVVQAAILAERMRVTVIMMVSVRMVTSVELTIAEILLALNLFLIAAIVQKKDFAQQKIPVKRIKEIAMITLSVQMNLSVG